ncbi:hypothetical protein NPIL_538401 [Nephila pilipes]|uniref:Uncharacterized protein n=1 Tax=Nephila pilipes TaxID=299642 RepID=A0A8X6P1J1_NEPPI|nr:hypothetical protein NPIL_538401 [Nephila pilipes]
MTSSEAKPKSPVLSTTIFNPRRNNFISKKISSASQRPLAFTSPNAANAHRHTQSPTCIQPRHPSHQPRQPLAQVPSSITSHVSHQAIGAARQGRCVGKRCAGSRRKARQGAKTDRQTDKTDRQTDRQTR